MARRFAVAVAIMTTLLLVVAAPSWAHHKAGHSGGAGKPAHAGSGSSGSKASGGGSSTGSGYTEDNDTNDNGTPNNVSDAGDNAHPSGKDKSVENGNSGNQGNSSSDPDDDGRGPDRSNGGADKPNGPGGVDLADQDGNNGCGNDDDFEDDNEGWCGKPKDKPAKDKKTAGEEVAEDDVRNDDKVAGDDVVCDKDVEMGNDVECGPRVDGDDEVLGSSIVDADLEGTDYTRVLGGELTRESPGAVDQPLARAATEAEEEGSALPFTGAELVNYVLLALGLVATGILLWRVRTSH